MAFAEEEVKDQARCFTTWDNSYFYLAFKVDCPDVQATHSTPNADIGADDGVEFMIETDNNHSEAISPACFAMAVSAAGGALFRAGDGSGLLTPVDVFSFRYGATVQGTLNNSDDIDMGYTVEIAVPWGVLKTKPPRLGDMMSFNVIVRRHSGGKENGFVSLSPKVEAGEDVLSPAKWSNIVFAASTFGVATTTPEKILSPRYVVRAPLVDGAVADREWHRNTSFAIDVPVPEGFVYEARFPIHRLVFTHYFYWYQADARKAAPLGHIVGSDGLPQLQDFPAKNAGPWFSYDRVQWHKEELSDIAAAGIDVVLPIYWGDRANRAGFAAKGLDCMVSALQELRSEGKPYPLVAMFFDTTAMMLAYGQKPDLRKPEVQRAFYGMIKDFFQRVPLEFRAVAQADKPDAGRPANIVFLYTSGFLSDFDSQFVQYCDQRFIQDFGYPLVWVASADFGDKAEGFDGFCNYGAGLGFGRQAGGRIGICAVGAGFDDSAVAARGKARIRPRMGGEAYQADWTKAFEQRPDWIVCDGWNEFHEGSDLCASREYDRKYIDATRANVDRFLGVKDFDAQYLRCSVPEVIPPKQFAQAELAIRNIGNSPWRTAEGYALAYRWYRSGRYYGESKVRRPLERDVFPGDTITVDIGIATVNAEGDELPEGDCEIRFELIRLSDKKWFSALGDQPLMVPLTIGPAPQWSATYLSCSAPVLMATGQTYPAVVRVRNDGAQTWKKGITKLGCELYKISNYTHDNSGDLVEKIPTNSPRALLTKDCKPGEIAEFHIDLNLVQPDKKPLPAWRQDLPWSYQLCCDIYNGEKWLSEMGVRTLDQVVDIFENDYGPRIVDCDVPATLPAGRTMDVKVVVKNNGTKVWDRKRTKIGYHWYHLDGREMIWEGQTTPIPANMNPGWPSVTKAGLKTPELDGRYVLVWDVMIDGEWLSTGPLSRGGDVLPVFVEVTGGKLAYVDLSNLYDVSATSPDTDRTAGDFDGKGSSFPSEYLPPDADVSEQARPVYPSGYNCGRHFGDGGIPEQQENRISFCYPDKAPGSKSAVACAGQKIDVEDGVYTAVHILGASTRGSAAGELSLNYTSGTRSAAIRMSDWGAGPAYGEQIGCMTRHRHSHGGDENGKYCYLYSYTVPIDSSRTLTSITLSKNPDMKIVAVTLERKDLPAAPNL